MIKGGLSVHEACLRDAAERGGDDRDDTSRLGQSEDDTGFGMSAEAHAAEV